MESVTDETRTTLDLPLAGRQTLRLIVGSGALSLAVGFGGAETRTPFTRPSWGEPLLRLPASLIPELLDALALLEASASAPRPNRAQTEGDTMKTGHVKIAKNPKGQRALDAAPVARLEAAQAAAGPGSLGVASGRTAAEVTEAKKAGESVKAAITPRAIER